MVQYSKEKQQNISNISNLNMTSYKSDFTQERR